MGSGLLDATSVGTLLAQPERLTREQRAWARLPVLEQRSELAQPELLRLVRLLEQAD